MRFWDSKPCRVIGGLAVLAAAILAITTLMFDYPIAAWTLGTWLGVGLLVACLLGCCCLGAQNSLCRKE